MSWIRRLDGGEHESFGMLDTEAPCGPSLLHVGIRYATTAAHYAGRLTNPVQEHLRSEQSPTTVLPAIQRGLDDTSGRLAAWRRLFGRLRQ